VETLLSLSRGFVPVLTIGGLLELLGVVSMGSVPSSSSILLTSSLLYPAGTLMIPVQSNVIDQLKNIDFLIVVDSILIIIINLIIIIIINNTSPSPAKIYAKWVPG
jgi:hypothetical protein